MLLGQGNEDRRGNLAQRRVGPPGQCLPADEIGVPGTREDGLVGERDAAVGDRGAQHVGDRGAIPGSLIQSRISHFKDLDRRSNVGGAGDSDPDRRSHEVGALRPDGQRRGEEVDGPLGHTHSATRVVHGREDDELVASQAYQEIVLAQTLR